MSTSRPFLKECPLCGAKTPRIVYDFSGRATRHGIPGLILCCDECGLWYKQENAPGGHTQVYGDDYAEENEQSAYMGGEAARRFFAKALSRVRLSRSGAERPRLLDVGAGRGTLIEVANQAGFDGEGIEACQPLAEQAKARGLQVTFGTADDLEGTEAYDVVTLMDIIEHVPDPMALLRKVHQALKPGGEVVVYTPNHRGAVVLLARALHHLGVHGPVRNIFAGNHLFFFDTRTLPRALRAAGFDVRESRLFPYNPARPGMPISIASLVMITAVEWLGLPFRRVFRMMYYARKP